MAKKKAEVKYPIITEGKHSIRKEYEDGRVEFETDWDKLKAEVIAVLEEYAANKPMKPAVKAKTARKKKDVQA